MSQGATLDWQSVSLYFGGYRITGFAPGSPLRVAYSAPQFAMEEGNDGLSLFRKNKRKGGRIEFSLMPNADANDVLSGIFNADFEAPGGLVLPVFVKDNGRSRAAGEAARLETIPEVTRSDSGDVMAWAILVARLDLFAGGFGVTPVGSAPA